MNVIISQDRSVRLTQTSDSAYNIRDIVVYIAKGIEVSDAVFNLKVNRNVYPFWLDLTNEITNYKLYKVIFTQSVSLSEREYDISIALDGEEIEVGSFPIRAIKYNAPSARMMSFRRNEPETPHGLYGLTDDDAPIEIYDRDIVMSTVNTLIAEDNISQCLRFRMPRFYDGIDLSTKEIYFDYLKEVEEDEERVTKLFNILIHNGEASSKTIEIESLEENGTPVDYLIISFTVPYAVIDKAGTIPFALSAVDAIGEFTTEDGEKENPDNPENYATQYVWQTKPAYLTITANLFKRGSVPATNTTINAVEELLAGIDQLNRDVETIQSSDIYNADNNEELGELEIGGGGASSVL